MEEPKIAKKAAYIEKVEKGKTYNWCACGRSNSQPFCDGSHEGTSFTPVTFTPEKTGTVYLCGCKHTKKPPFCDGTHKTL